jgi:hypothetical protein
VHTSPVAAPAANRSRCSLASLAAIGWGAGAQAHAKTPAASIIARSMTQTPDASIARAWCTKRSPARLIQVRMSCRKLAA